MDNAHVTETKETTVEKRTVVEQPTTVVEKRVVEEKKPETITIETHTEG